MNAEIENKEDLRTPLPASVPRVVIGHDFMETYGGAERIVREMAHIFPDAPLYAILGRESVAKRMGVDGRFHGLLRARPALLRHYRGLAPAFPPYLDHIRLPAADVLLTSSYAFAHHMRTENDAPQLCYCYAPLRFAWSMSGEYRAHWAGGPVRDRAFDAMAAWMRRTDRRVAKRVERYVALSEYAARQIRDAYRQDCEVLPPPVDTDLFTPADDGPQDFFLFCGRLVEPYKQPIIAVQAFAELDARLVVAGDGPELERLKRLATPNVEFVGHLEDEALVWHMQHCQATIFPSRDDFGLIPVEVAACGRPTLAYAGGGALETVKPGVTGAFFEQQSVAMIVDAVSAFRTDDYDPAAIREHALGWSSHRFGARLRELVDELAALRS